MPYTIEKIAVLGAGAMGSLFGGLLAEGGLNVTLIDVWKEHIEAIKKTGLRITGEGGDRFVPIAAEVSASSVGEVDLVFVQTKTRYTKEAVLSAKALFGPSTIAVSFQNGMGNAELLQELLGKDNVIGGTTAQGSGIVGPGVIRNAGNLPTKIGELAGGLSERVTIIANTLTASGLPTETSENIVYDLWKKLMANVAINPISALCDFRAGELFDVPEVKDMIFLALEEAETVAQACGINIHADQTKEVLYKITGPEGTGSNRSGMLIDVMNKRKTEIDVINGYIVRQAKKHNIPVPVNQTLVALVKGKERNYS